MTPPNEEETQNGGTAANADGSQGTPAGGEGGEQDSYFLEIDDRTRYRTQDDAIKGVREAGERIVKLAPYERIAQDYGIEDPNELPELLDELATLRAAKEAAGESGGTKKAASPAGDDAAANAAIDDSGLSDEDKAALKWAKRVGIVTNNDLQTKIAELQGTVEKLGQGRQADEAARMEALVDDGRAYVPELLREHKLPVDDKKFVERVERHMRAYLEFGSVRNDQIIKGSPLDRFYRGGRTQQAVVNEAFQDFLETYQFSTSRKATDYAAEKAGAQNGAPKPLPKGGIPAGEKPDDKPATFSDAHKSAWDRYQEHLRAGR